MKYEGFHKYLAVVLAVVSVATLPVLAETDARTLGYDLDGDGTLEALPSAPDMSGDVVNVTAEQAQYVLDGAYGSIDGKTINFTENIDTTLILGRATKYEGSGTTYHSFNADYVTNTLTYTELIADKSWCRYYDRTVQNITFTAKEGVTLKGFNAEGGNHIYGTTATPLYDCVRDISTKNTINSYYKRTTLKNITFKGLTFTTKTDIATSNAATVFDGFTFTGCTFNINNGTTNNSDYQALRYYDENNSGNVMNLVVENCAFNGCYQGVFAANVKGVKVADCTFDTMYHNAIAVQTTAGHGACNFGAVVLTGNTFSNLSNRAIRFGVVGADTQFTIKNNVVESTTSTEECIKASGGEDLADGVTCDIDYNDWGTYSLAEPAQLRDKTMVAKIGTTEYSTLSAAINAATSGQTVKLIADLQDESCCLYDLTGVTLDLNGYTYSHYNDSHAFQGTGGAIKNGKMVCLNNGSYVLYLGCDEGATTSFTIENVEMTGGINMGKATGVVLENTTITGTDYYAIWAEANSSVTIKSGTYTAGNVAVLCVYSNSSIIIEGGTFNMNGKSLVNTSVEEGYSPIVPSITGGKFDVDLTADEKQTYLASGYETYQSSDNLYSVKSTTSTTVTVAVEESKTEEGTSEKTVEVVLPNTILDEVTGSSEEDKAEALSKTADNGNPVWVNIVAGIESDKSVAVDAAQNTDATTIEVSVSQIDKPVDGFSFAYEVDEVNLTTSDGGTTAEVKKEGEAVSAPVIDIDNVETSAYFRVNVVLRQNGSTVAKVPATNYVGVLKKTTKMTKAIVPVPWHSLADGEDISVSNIVKTANLTVDDKLYVYDTANKKYNVYTLQSDKTWKGTEVYTIDDDGQMSSSSSGTPESTRVARGSGVWLERQDTSTPIVTYGLASTAKQDTELASGTAESPTWNLVAVPSTEPMKLDDLAKATDAANDKIIVPTEGAPKIYTVKNGKWGCNEKTKVGDDGLVIKRNETDTSLPAGTGFWYLNGSESEKKVNW